MFFQYSTINSLKEYCGRCEYEGRGEDINSPYFKKVITINKSKMENKINLIDLQKELSYQWRVQSFSKNKPVAACVAYIDARDVMRHLDEVCGAENWQDDYRLINGQLFAGIGIFCNDKWIWKWDVGTESQTEKEKGVVSDSFKRAAVKWGVGRFLYDLPIVHVKSNGKKGDHDNADTKKYPQVIDEQGKTVYDVTLHINSKNKK